MSVSLGSFPVFVFPQNLKFFLNSRNTHKQLLTLYNPSNIPVRFTVLGTAPTKYSVTDPEGSIGPQASVDIIIRHTAATSTNCNLTDKFKITLFDHATRQPLGRKVVEATLFPGEKENASEGDSHSSPPFERQVADDEKSYYSSVSQRNVQIQPPRTANWMSFVIGFMCFCALFMPTRMEVSEPSSLPVYMHVSVNLKIVAGFVLGFIIKTVFQP